MNDLAKSVYDTFKKKFNAEPDMFYSPGRINFIGEHIDYNDGFVMPAAIDKGIYFAIKQNNTDLLNFQSIDFNDSLKIKIKDIKKLNGWKNYVLGVVNEFKMLNKITVGFDCVFGGDIANGGGMSSSAAVEGGVAFAINQMNSLNMTRRELALLCQKAEHNYPGVMCGIMDQYANMFGKKDQVILLDCKTVNSTYLPLKLDGFEVVLINSKVHHSLATSAYNERRKECEKGLQILRENQHINSFRDVTDLSQLSNVKEQMGDLVYKRCKYVVEEISRTQTTAELLKENKIEQFGHLMFQTHYGLRDLYEVSCKEIDFLVELAEKIPAVIGCRQMGGGFGGCTINIIKADQVKNVVNEIVAAYQKKFHIDPEHYQVHIVDGTHQLFSN